MSNTHYKSACVHVHSYSSTVHNLHNSCKVKILKVCIIVSRVSTLQSNSLSPALVLEVLLTGH